MTRVRDTVWTILFVCCALWCGGAAVAADVYRWTDADGQVHYGRRPPDPGSASRVEVPAGTDEDQRVDTNAADRRDRQRRLLDAYAYERQRKRREAAEAAQQRERTAQRCRSLQARWRRLSFAGPIYVKRADGGRDYLSEDQRSAERQRLRPAYIEACGGSPP